MSIAVLVSRLADRGVRLYLDGGDLRFRAPAGALSDEDKARLRARKSELLAYLAARDAARIPSLTAQPSAAPAPSLYQQVWWRLVRASVTPLKMEKVALFLPFADTDPPKAEAALRGLVARHDTFRSRFFEADGRLALSINPPHTFTVTHGTAPDEAAAYAQAADFLARPLPVDGDWLSRGLVIQVEGGRTFCGLVAHHIIFDGSSLGIAAGELNDRIAGLAADGEAAQHLDYARWEQHWFAQEAGPLIAWWRDWLAALPRLRAPSGRDLTWAPGARVDHPLPLGPTASARIEQTAVKLGATPFAVILAVYARALARWSGQSRFPIRAVGDLRTSEALARMVGLLICGDAMEAEDADGDIGMLVARMGAEHRSAASMRLPSHPDGTGAGFGEFHEKIAATVNYIPAGAVRIETRGPPLTLPMPPNRAQTLPWPVPLASIFLRLWTGPDGLEGRLEFNEALITEDEQTALVAAFLAALDEAAPDEDPVTSSDSPRSPA